MSAGKRVLPQLEPMRCVLGVLVALVLIGLRLGPPSASAATIDIHHPDISYQPDDPDTTPALSYDNVSVCLYIDSDSAQPIQASAFDFRICYEPEYLFLRTIEPGSDLHPDWEYFTYRTGSLPAQCATCPTSQFRIVGFADIHDGITPDSSAFTLDGCLANLGFVTSRDATGLGQCHDIRFCSFSCWDNTITTIDASTILVGDTTLILSDSYDLPHCSSVLADSAAVDSSLTFKPAYICIRDPLLEGDLNLNFFPYEVGDAVIYANYFLAGEDVFSTEPGNRTIQIQMSDINNDGQELTMADYVTLVNWIDLGKGQSTVGPPKLTPKAGDPVQLSMINNGNEIVLSYYATTPVGGAFFTFELQGADHGQPDLIQDSDLDLRARVRGNELRVFIGPDVSGPGGLLPMGQVSLLRIPTREAASVTLSRYEMSDSDGRYLDVVLVSEAVPRSPDLGQNYPNPFNRSTVIPYSLIDAGHVRFDVFDVLGRRVMTLVDAYRAAGQHTLAWDGTNDAGQPVATGVYFYRLTIDGRSSSRSMLLLK